MIFNILMSLAIILAFYVWYLAFLSLSGKPVNDIVHEKNINIATALSIACFVMAIITKFV